MSWRNISNGAADFDSAGTGTDTGPLIRETSSQSGVYTNQFVMSPEAEAARAAAASEQSRIEAEVAERLPDQASRFANDKHDLQFNLEGGGKKRTKKRTVRRKRTYKKSKRTYKSKRSYKGKRSYKSKRSVKRGGVTSDSIHPITFNISIPYKPNEEKPRSFQIVLNSNQTGKDLINEMNRLLNRGVIYLTEKEKKFPRKLVFPDGTPVKYNDRLEFYWSDTLFLPLRNDDRIIAAAPVARAAAAPVAPVARAAAAGPNPDPARGDDDDVLDPNPAPPVAVPRPRAA